MKKTYIRPEITIIALDREILMQSFGGSGEGNGEDSAAKRGGASGQTTKKTDNDHSINPKRVKPENIIRT